MKPISKFFWLAILGGAVLILVTGCATSRPIRQALVCPQCKNVTINRFPQPSSPDKADSYAFWNPDTPAISHTCPGCKGILTTLFTEGTLRHECSICEQAPFSCSISSY